MLAAEAAMGIFKRIFEGAQQPPDWAGFFQPVEFSTFLNMIKADLDRRGLLTHIDGPNGVVMLRNPGQEAQRLGLQNLAQMCHTQDCARWPEVIARHFSTVLNMDEASQLLEDCARDFEKARGLIKVRLYPRDWASMSVPTVYEELAEGFVAALVYDLPDRIGSVHPDHAAAWNVSQQDLFEIGLANVRANDLVKHAHTDLPKGGTLQHLIGDTFFAASHALFLDEYLPADNHWGAVVAMPHRHAVFFHPIANLSVVPSINALIFLADKMFQDGPGSISPSLYWFRAGGFTLLPARISKKSIEFHPTAEFVEMLSELSE
jgi:hypothetical protein